MIQNAKPILFNTEMVQALLDGRKTCTRRLVKPQPCIKNNESGTFVPCDDGSFQLSIDRYNNLIYDYPIKPRYYKNDILYVRESFIKTMIDNPRYFYKTDVLPETLKHYKFTPSIHMPKEAARIFLRVTDVSVERMQDITEQEALSEGIYFDEHSFVKGFTSCREHDEGVVWDTAVNCFRWHVWNKTVKSSEQDLYGWNANPWVWVYEFEKIESQSNK